MIFAFEKLGGHGVYEMKRYTTISGETKEGLNPDVRSKMTELLCFGHALSISESDGLLFITHYLSCVKCFDLRLTPRAEK